MSTFKIGDMRTFKIGDRVRLTTDIAESGLLPPELTHPFYPAGTEGVVTEYDGAGPVLKLDNGELAYVWTNEIELVESAA